MAFKDRLGDRRAAMRFEIIGQLWGSLETVNRLKLRNLARGGALVETAAPPNPDLLHAVRLGVNGTAHDIKVRICHVTPRKTAEGERYFVGLQFVDPSGGALEGIERLVEARLAELGTIPEA
jgi:hypothetical protein